MDKDQTIKAIDAAYAAAVAGLYSVLAREMLGKDSEGTEALKVLGNFAAGLKHQNTVRAQALRVINGEG